MNFLINRLDNLDIGSKSFEFIPENIKKDINMDGMIVGANGQFLVNQKDIKVLIKKSLTFMRKFWKNKEANDGFFNPYTRKRI